MFLNDATATPVPNSPAGSTEPALPPELSELPAESPWVTRQRVLLRELKRLIAERASLEPQLERDYKAKIDVVEEKFEIDYQGVIIRFASDKEKTDAELKETLKILAENYKEEQKVLKEGVEEARVRISSEYEEARHEAKHELNETSWTLTTLLEGGKTAADHELQDTQQRLTDLTARIERIRQDTRGFLESCRQYRMAPTHGTFSYDGPRTVEQVRERVDAAAESLEKLKALRLTRLFKSERPFWLVLALFVLSSAAITPLAGWLYGPLGCALGVVIVGVGAGLWLQAVLTQQVDALAIPLFQSLSEAEILAEQCQERAKRLAAQQRQDCQNKFDHDMNNATLKYKRLRAQIKQRRTQEWQAAVTMYREGRHASKRERDRAWEEAESRHRQTRTEIQERYEHDSKHLHDKRDKGLALYKDEYDTAVHKMVSDWGQGLTFVRDEIAALQKMCQQSFPEWSPEAWGDWVPSQTIPPAIPFGAYRLALPGEAPNDTVSSGTVHTLPALLSFPQPFSLVLQCSREGRQQAVQVLQAVMFRLLTSLPPAKVRFIILDPVGLGQNFASFMHLADADEALISSRIWTEQTHIEQRLADLTGHMENVIQKYLRNQFRSLEDYNANAGEVAEPYRILVAANFPANFNNEAIRRLVSVLQSGPRCGVYTLLTVDSQLPWPVGLDPAELDSPGVHLTWHEQRPIWHDPDFKELPLQIERPPDGDFATRLLKEAGELARIASKVQVPFEFVAPAPDEWWTGDTRHGLNVPLGRVGATKRQFLKLGVGTSQHVLIAGKTGSGKSTLLHALITNLALCYDPLEVELYLVDFKKGVEFKTYATHELPHARVIAVESEREFGLSVLQRLDGELKARGEMFRSHGAQDLRAYRQASGKPLPRILLIVDEFQEFFVEDDKIAQEATLLLDRLVRQGRAFGLHILLGSQTLGGAYSLARSTIDQMAVRIALQCSETDACLILSEDNTAARLLSRPGEAIYNDANGLVEGNNPFQVVWLSDQKREEYLRKVQEMAAQKQRQAVGQIVFEGNTPAEPARNVELQQLLDATAWPEKLRAPVAWLGEAIAIKDPTASIFRAQSGSNLLILGQNEEAALGMLSLAAISLAAQLPPAAEGRPGGACFWVLDGTLEDSANIGFFERVKGSLPHTFRLTGWRELSEQLEELSQELDRRLQGGAVEGPAHFLIVFGLQRFRELRKLDDDYGFGREEKTSPAKRFASLLRDGPAVGIHTLVWCDNLNNLNRTLERQSMREFEMKALFQMSANDSSNLIDSPLASKLGMHRALYHSEEQGRIEKFRAYGLPSADWLAFIKQRLGQRSSDE